MKVSLSDVVKKPYWSKDICVWIGTETGVLKATEGERNVSLDLLDLFTPGEDVPADDMGRTQLIELRLDSKLQELRRDLPERRVLILKNAALLARYRVGLGPIYDWFGGDKKMAVLVLTSQADFRLPLHLNRDVKCDCEATVDYLTSCLANQKLVFRERQ